MLPKAIDDIVHTLIAQGIRPVLVGGYLRDWLWNQRCGYDIDLELYGLETLEHLIKLLEPFGKAVLVGKSFGVVKLTYQGYSLDLSQPRTETKIAAGHRGFEIHTHIDLDFETAASRRDFTINAMGYDLLTESLLDPFGGLEDLRKRRLECVMPERFVEDPLRLLRAVQFAARFGLTCSPRLIELCRTMHAEGSLDELPKERIFHEIQKLLLSPAPSIGFILLESMQAVKLLHGLETLAYEDRMRLYARLDRLASNNERTLTIMLAALALNFDEIVFEGMLDGLTQEKRVHEEVRCLWEGYQMLLKSLYVTPYTVRLLASKMRIRTLLILEGGEEESQMMNRFEQLRQTALKLGLLDSMFEPLLHGRDLILRGVTPSPLFSVVLNRAFEAQLHGLISNREEALRWLDGALKE